ncbi:hypothetical protein HW130_29100 [Streptomyces sp. PKU-EA00015]|uniref:hypothetical protein n=1 Tax=Streptomyces sp. PKU-EA00015 TaxID=2748326 RepID=UPI0015A2B7B5|nr:hypothetical protein [Streptomyces sp. PKU-EA00015]NWF30267.1 hypothetical protein [Streptomyces sp. PKU-EA00015]
MAVASDMLVSALREVRKAEAALADRFTAHIAGTPAGEYRECLERRVGDARGYVYRIDERLGTMQPRGMMESVLGNAWRLAGQASRLSFGMTMAVPTAVFRSRGRATEHQLLKNVEDEYAITAYAVAVCRAAECIAQEAQDAVSSELLSSIRRDHEEALEELGNSLEQRAEAAMLAAQTTEGAKATGAAQAVRAWSSWLRETAERMPGADRLQGASEGAFIRDYELPIPDFRRLSTREILERLPHLSQRDLDTVGAYERAHATRPAILNRIADLLGPEPWPSYDSMHEDEIVKRLADAEEGLTRRVLTYERRHQARSSILTAAERIPA